MAARFLTREASITVRLEKTRYVLSWKTASDAYWRAILASLKEAFPERGDEGLLFETEPRKRWSVPSWKRSALDRWLAVTFDLPAITWATSTSAQASHTDALADAHAALYLTPDAPLWMAEAAYRAAQKQYHPDIAGGSHTAAARINRAIAIIRDAHTTQQRRAS